MKNFERQPGRFRTEQQPGRFRTEQQPGRFRTTLILTLAVGMFSGCQKDDKDDKDSSPKTELIASASAYPDADGQIVVRPTSTVKGATFQCSMIPAELKGQGQEQWVDCASEGHVFAAEPGVQYIIKVKATKGSKSVESAEFLVAAGGQTQQPEPEEEELWVEILNKPQIGQTYAQRTLVVNFGIRGGQIAATDVLFECMSQDDGDFTQCNGGDSYDFGELENGKTYELKVRGTVTADGRKALEDMIKFKAQREGLPIVGREQLNDHNANAHLQVNLNEVGASTMSCTLNHQASSQSRDLPCSDGNIRINLRDQYRYQQGMNTLSIEARDAQGVTVGKEDLSFCARSCGQDAPTAPVISRFQIGDFYEYIVPNGRDGTSNPMHVTQYATTKTITGALDFWRITNTSDPGYHYNYTCGDEEHEVLETYLSPAGQSLDYCHSTPRDREFKWMFELNYAFNHLEVATDSHVVEANEQLDERILINVFDDDYEFMQERSRFEKLCMNRRGQIQVSPPIRLLRDYWYDNVRGHIWMCQTILTSTRGGFGSQSQSPYPENWFVGTFFIDSTHQKLPKFECYQHGRAWYDDAHPMGYCGNFRNPNLIEVVYMARANGLNNATFYQFAQTMQERFLRNLRQTVPQ